MKLSYDGCFLTFKDENKSSSIRLVCEGRTFDTEGVELYVAEILRLIIAKMKEISMRRKHIFLDDLTNIGIEWGGLTLCPCSALLFDIIFTLQELDFIQHHKREFNKLEHYTFTDEASAFLKAIPKRRKRARLDVAMK